MVELELPARHDWAVQEKNYGKLVMEPFEPGFALTLASASRRALLSAINEARPSNSLLIDGECPTLWGENFLIDPVAIGRERLVVEVWADGSVVPAAAVAEAARILEDHCALGTDFAETTPEVEAAERDETR